MKDRNKEAEMENLIRHREAEFVSVVSHELRTPLTSIKGYADMLMSGMAGEVNDTQKKFLRIIRANAERLSNLVSDLLDIVRLEAGQVKLNLQPLNLGELISETALSVEEHIQEKGLELSLSIPPEVPPVLADRERISQAIKHLLNNAWQYTPAGGKISVSLNSGGGELLVRISDTGIGISSEDRARLFTRFFRADHPLVRERSGAGLGLSLVKSIVELHGGKIWVESEPDAGSTFSFTLPLAH
ncbi:MAG: sensor histidine kinase [Anaerolineae bacterium]